MMPRGSPSFACPHDSTRYRASQAFDDCLVAERPALAAHSRPESTRHESPAVLPVVLLLVISQSLPQSMASMTETLTCPSGCGSFASVLQLPHEDDQREPLLPPTFFAH